MFNWLSFSCKIKTGIPNFHTSLPFKKINYLSFFYLAYLLLLAPINVVLRSTGLKVSRKIVTTIYYPHVIKLIDDVWKREWFFIARTPLFSTPSSPSFKKITISMCRKSALWIYWDIKINTSWTRGMQFKFFWHNKSICKNSM